MISGISWDGSVFERGGIVKTLAFLSRNILLFDFTVSPFHGDFVKGVTSAVYYELVTNNRCFHIGDRFGFLQCWD